MPLSQRVTDAVIRIGQEIKALRELVLSSGGGGGSVFFLWAEENNALGNNTYEWAYGNGANTPVGGGIVMGVNCELISMTCQSGSATGSQEIQMVINGSPNATYKVTAANGTGFVEFGTPLVIPAGTRVNFRTLVGGGAASPNTVSAWFRTT